MIKNGILNPHLNSLLCRIRHTNRIVIADRGFPFFPGLETVDISLINGIPTVLDVFLAIEANFTIGNIWMAHEFTSLADHHQGGLALRQTVMKYPLTFEPHNEFKQRAASAIGLIRTADTLQYANLILESS